MPTYLLSARHDMGDVKRGYMLQVVSSSCGHPHERDIKAALLAAGFNLKGLFNNTKDAVTASNWNIERYVR